MKSLLTAFFAILITVLFCQPPAQAQGLPGDKLDIISSRAVAFVKADRGSLYIKRAGKPVENYDLAALLTDATQGAMPIDSFRHLAVIGMTPNQDHIVLGGAVYFVNPLNQQHTSFIGIFRLPWPITGATVAADPPVVNLSLPWLLRASRNGLGGFHPVGVLSPDGKDWYGMTISSSQGNDSMVFYHGKVVGGTSVDSAVVTTEIAGNGRPPQGGWLTSNIALDTVANMMLVEAVDGMQDPSQSGRFLIVRWKPGGALPVFAARDITGQVKGLTGRTQAMYFIDSLFGLTIAPKQDGALIDLAITNDQQNINDGSIHFYSTRYNSNDPLANGQLGDIPRSVIPDAGATFFAGGKTILYQDDNFMFHNHGQGGDMIVTNDRSTALFITHGYPLDSTSIGGRTQRNVKSAIYTYDFSGSAKLVYNDSTAQELQPVFVPAVDTFPHAPYIKANQTSKDFGKVDTNKTSAAIALTVSDTSTFAGMIIDSAVISGTNASEFHILGPTFPQTVQYNGSLQINVQFAPVGAAGSRSATLKVYSSMTTNKVTNITLSGTANVPPPPPPPNSVSQDPVLLANMTVEPNPFTARTTIDLVAPEDGALGIVIHDALGRTIYTSDARKVGAGAMESFTFDAKSLALPNGLYYVTAFIGERSATRQVVFVR